MAVLFFDSFEGQDLNRYDTVSGATISTSSYKYGAAAVTMRANSYYVEKNLSAAQGELYISFWFKPNSTSQNSGLVTIFSGGTTVLEFGHDDIISTGRLYAWKYGNTGTIYAGTTSVSADWNHIQLRLKMDQSAGAIQAKLNGTLEIDETSLDTTSGGSYTTVDEFRIGDVPTANWYANGEWDNIVVVTDDWPGDLQIGYLGPTADGNSSDWVPSTGTDNYAMVDEVPVSTADYVATNTAGDIDTFTTEDLSVVPNAIKAVQVLTRVLKSGTPTPTSLRHVVRVNGTDYSSADYSTPTDGYLNTIWETNPDDSAAWEYADVNGMEIGYEARS